MRWVGLLSVVFAAAIIVWAILPSGAAHGHAQKGVGGAAISRDDDKCMANLHLLATAISTYAVDHDNRFPSADHWSSAISDYASNNEAYRCPAVGKFGYAFNRSLGTKPLSAEGRTPVIFDSSDLRADANDNLQSLPAPPRHQDHNGRPGNLAVTLDGQATWLQR